MQDESYTNAMAIVNQKYPVIGKHNIGVTKASGPYFSEFYPPWESESPWKGRPTIALHEKSYGMQGQDLENLLAGESLHHLGSVNPETNQPIDNQWYEMRKAFANTLTPHQQAIDNRAYISDVKSGDTRPFPEWFDTSRLDAHLRGFLFPDQDNQWKDAYTPLQKMILQEMGRYLEGSR